MTISKRVSTAVLLIVGLLSVLFVSRSSADPLDNWHVRGAGLTTDTLTGIAYGNGIFVAVGRMNTVLTSPDGINWTKQQLPELHHFVHIEGITFGGGLFVAVGVLQDSFGYPRGTVILSSPNGANWTATFKNVGLSIAYGNGKFVAVGGNLAWSLDGLNWTVNSQPSNLWSIIFSDGQFLALSWDNNEIFSSHDGITWVRRMDGAYSECSRLVGIAYGNHTLAAVGGWCLVCFTGFPCRMVAISHDFIHWTAPEGRTGSALRAVIFGAGNFVAVGWNSIEVSVNGDNWKKITMSNEYALNAVEYIGGTFVAVGENGTILQSDPVPSINETVGVPTLSEWGMMLFMVLAGLLAIINLPNHTRVS